MPLKEMAMMRRRIMHMYDNGPDLQEIIEFCEETICPAFAAAYDGKWAELAQDCLAKFVDCAVHGANGKVDVLLWVKRQAVRPKYRGGLMPIAQSLHDFIERQELPPGEYSRDERFSLSLLQARVFCKSIQGNLRRFIPLDDMASSGTRRP